MSSRELDDFTDIIKDTVRRLTRDSSTVRLIDDEIANDRKCRDLATDVIRDIFDDADKDNQLYGRNDNFNEAIINEASYAVLGVCADVILSNDEWEDLNDNIYKALKTGIEIHKDALDRLDRDDYENSNRRSRDRGDRGGRDRDRGRNSRKSRDNGRDNTGRRRSGERERNRERREERNETRTRDKSKPVRAHRAYSGGAARRDAEGTTRSGQTLSDEGMNDLSSSFIEELKDTGIADMARLMGQMADAGVGIDVLIQYRADRNLFNEFKDNRESFIEYLNVKNQPTFGGKATGTMAGLVLDSDRVLVNGEVKPMEHYMEHELSENARRANMARYGMQPERHVRVPETEEEVKRFRDVEKLTYAKAGIVEVDNKYSDLVDYVDVVGVAADAFATGDVVVGDVMHHYEAVVNFEQISRMLSYAEGIYVPPHDFAGLHTMMRRTVTEVVGNDSMDLNTPAIARLLGMLEDSATDYFNQCLALVGIEADIENFYEDFDEAMEYVETLDRSTRRDLHTALAETFKDMFNITIEPMEDGMAMNYRLRINRTTTVLYTTAPVIGKETRLTDEGYNILMASNAPATYEMLDSALRQRKNRAEMVMVDQYDNRYVVNCVRAGAGLPIAIREL